MANIALVLLMMEMTMNRVRNFLSIAAFSLMVLGLPAIASAQYGYPNGQYDPYGRNGGYGNGQYGNYGYGGDIRSAVRELKDLSRRFEKDLDRSPIYSKNNNNGRYGNGNWGGWGGYG